MIPAQGDRRPWWPLHVAILGWLFLALAVTDARAQFTRFEAYADEQGLGNLSVSALAQDSAGYILLGTEAGLYRYDGSRITPYDVSVGLPSGAWIRQIATDGAGRVWVATTDGLYLRDGGAFGRVDVGRHLELTSPHLLALTDGAVYLDVGGSVLRAPVRLHAVGPFLPLFDAATLATAPALARSRFVIADTDGSLLIGCGAAICRARSGQVSVLGTASGLPPAVWQVALRTPDGTLWARSLDLLAWRKPGDSSFTTVRVPGQRGLFYSRVPAQLALVADGHGGILTQGENNLLDWNGTTWRSYQHHAGGLAPTPIDSLLFDREGSLWVGSWNYGAFRSIGLDTWEHWTVDDGLPSDLVWGMTRLKNGQLWIATYADTVALDGKAAGFPGGSESVAASRDGRLWLAPLGSPLVRVDHATGTIDHLPSVGIMRPMFIDHDNRLWLSSDKGLLLVADADAPASRLHAELVLPHQTLQVTTDPSGRIWAATQDGIYRRDSAGHFILVVPPALLGGQQQGMAFTLDGDLWIPTESAGVLRLHLAGGKVEPLAPITAPVIGSDNILFVYGDRRGWMWVGTDHGIDMFNGRSWRRFDKVDGSISNDMNQYAVYEDPDGSMWFGTSHGLTHLLDPTRLPEPPALHPLVTGLSLGSRRLSPAPSIRLDWSSGSLVIRFVDLNYAYGRGITFRYRLSGVDTGWNDTTSHEARYARLPAGKFRFELISTDPIHGAASRPVGFTIRIRPPWWQRWWFYLLCSLGVAAILFLIWQARTQYLLRQQRRLEEEQRRLEEVVVARTAEIEQARKQLQILAMSDALTGLANRHAIMVALEDAVAAALPSGTFLAVLLCDIDHFKKINDGFGHLAGDAVLAAFGNRLKAAVALPEMAGRYGGEEFLVILPGDRQTIMQRVAAVRSAISDAPYRFRGADRIVTSSGGLAFLRPGDNALSFLARADTALYQAKENGRNRIENERPETDADAAPRLDDHPTSDARPSSVDQPDPNQQSRNRSDLERDLRAALAGNQFVLHYQPVADLNKDEVTSCEALLRWSSPSRGNVPPVEFIPFAEEIGLMPEIGDWVLRAACREAASWPNGLRVAVNLSPVQLRLPDLVETVVSALAEAGLPPERLELELTETAMIENLAAAASMLQQLRAMGVTIALDDFGTGYSSLSFLRTLPFDRIKIDRSFVQDLGARPEAAAIITAITGLCSSLGISVTAEGVETDQQIELLRQLGCSDVQGYRIGRPCSASALQDWLAAFTASHMSRPPVAPDGAVANPGASVSHDMITPTRNLRRQDAVQAQS